VFEHIPNYKKALAECCRCLKPGGMLLFSVPFVKTSAKNIVRAQVSNTGEVIHLLPPEYHGDPLRSEGCLSFYHFGWEILDELNTMRFKDVKALLYWSQELGYLGGEQVIFMATKIP
jgi:SAM-dependent methyltransferase